MTGSLLNRKEPENAGNRFLSATGKDRKAPLRGHPVLSAPERPRGRPAASGLVSLSPDRAEAIRRFSKDAERAELTRDADLRLEVRQSLAGAIAAMSIQERAIIDLLVIRGRDITRLAQVSGQTVDVLRSLLHRAADTLAAHYQSRETF